MSRLPPTEEEMLRTLSDGQVSLGPFHIELETPLRSPDLAGDGVLGVRWSGVKIHRRFAFEVRGQWSQRHLDQALTRLRESSLPPLVIFPYLADDHLDELLTRGVSGLDLCGNGLLYGPPNLFVLRSGAPSEFRHPAVTPLVYQSRTLASLVPRVFLVRSSFQSVREVQETCHARMMGPRGGGRTLALSTVSKALAQLEEDLVITRKGRASRLIEPDRLITNLTRAFNTPAVTGHFLGKTPLAPAELWRRLQGLRPATAAVATGRASAGHYTGLTGPERQQLYVSDLRVVQEALEARPTQAFPNLELFETADHAPYFDARLHEGALWSSPIQTYLELAHGSAREVDTSQELQARLVQQARGGGLT